MAVSVTKLEFWDAVGIIVHRCTLVQSEEVAATKCIGRVLGEPAIASCDYPRADMAALDGFTLPHVDVVQGAQSFVLGAAINTGAIGEPVVAGIANPISTGAGIPLGAGAVVARKHAVAHGTSLDLAKPVAASLNIRSRGEDTRAGEKILGAGTLVGPAGLGALLSGGVQEVAVRRAIRIVIIPTGNELQSDGLACIADLSGPMIAASLACQRYVVDRYQAEVDSEDAVATAFDRAILAYNPDVIFTVGGASGGSRDVVAAAARRLGADFHLSGVKMRPGKPVLFATLPDGRLFFGLPGNPVAALVACRFFVNAALRCMVGLPGETGTPVACDTGESQPHTRVLAATLEREADGRCRANIVPGQKSHRLRPLLDGSHWLVVGAGESRQGLVFPFEAR